jgi:hypothetical protein
MGHPDGCDRDPLLSRLPGIFVMDGGRLGLSQGGRRGTFEDEGKVQHDDVLIFEVMTDRFERTKVMAPSLRRR